jgi:hypothetical protein
MPAQPSFLNAASEIDLDISSVNDESENALEYPSGNDLVNYAE